MRYLILILIVSFSLPNTKIFGSCIACWELKKIKIFLKNGSTSTGYVLWNDLWSYPIDTSFKYKFPESLILASDKLKKDIILYKNVILYEYLSIKAPLALDDIDTIKVNSISRIISIPDSFENLTGASGIQVITKDIANKIKEIPYEIYITETGYSEVLILSYNKHIKKEKLVEISKTDFLNRKIEYEKLGIIILEFGFD